MRFSERIGKKPVKSLLQIDSIDSELQIRIWNIFVERLELITYYQHSASQRANICVEIWKDFFNYQLTSIPKTSFNYPHAPQMVEVFRKWFFSTAQWYEIYDFIEFVCNDIEHYNFKLNLGSKFNNALEREVSGYRIIEGKVVQITSEQEILSIEEALTKSDPYKSVNTHLRYALEMLADKTSPDYRNSIKESISSVEALCKIIVKDEKASLGKALAIIEKGNKLHPSLKEAYNKIYGYTSDAAGIRHAMLDDGESLTFEDAKFMLVSCSAFVNYLTSKISSVD